MPQSPAPNIGTFKQTDKQFLDSIRAKIFDGLEKTKVKDSPKAKIGQALADMAFGPMTVAEFEAMPLTARFKPKKISFEGLINLFKSGNSRNTQAAFIDKDADVYLAPGFHEETLKEAGLLPKNWSDRGDSKELFKQALADNDLIRVRQQGPRFTSVEINKSPNESQILKLMDYYSALPEQTTISHDFTNNLGSKYQKYNGDLEFNPMRALDKLLNFFSK